MIKGREKESRLLTNSLSLYGSPILIYGHSSTGKTLVAKDILKNKGLNYIYVNAKPCINYKIFFHEIISSSIDLCIDAGKDCPIMDLNSINDVNEFFISMTEIYKCLESKIILCIDNAYCLEGLYSGLINILVKHLTMLRCIFIDQQSLKPFISLNAPSICILFDNYSEVMMKKLLLDHMPNDVNVDIYSNFVSQLLSQFYNICHNFVELRYLTHFLWPSYIGDVNNDITPANKRDSRFLLNRFKPYFKIMFKNLYNHDYTIEKLHMDVVANSKLEKVSNQEFSSKDLVSTITSANTMNQNGLGELSRIMKLMLISSFICSYNPASSDNKYFSVFSNLNPSENKKRKKVTKKSTVSKLVLGPSVFTQTRLETVLEFIVKSDNETTMGNRTDVINNISTLCSHNFLERSTLYEHIVDEKFKCLMKYEDVSLLSQTVNFPLDKFLYEIE